MTTKPPNRAPNNTNLPLFPCTKARKWRATLYQGREEEEHASVSLSLYHQQYLRTKINILDTTGGKGTPCNMSPTNSNPSGVSPTPPSPPHFHVDDIISQVCFGCNFSLHRHEKLYPLAPPPATNGITLYRKKRKGKKREREKK